VQNRRISNLVRRLLLDARRTPCVTRQAANVALIASNE
jgi:hypothetical protein